MKVSDRPSEKVINVRFFATTGGSQRRATRPLIFAYSCLLGVISSYHKGLISRHNFLQSSSAARKIASNMHHIASNIHLIASNIHHNAMFSNILRRQAHSWSKATLPGGYSKEGLREWSILTNFGADCNANSQEMRRRRRQLSDDDLPYVDLFSKRVGGECCRYLADHPSPSDVLGKSFFGSNAFAAEKMFLSVLNSLYSNERATSNPPSTFQLGDTYLQWTVTSKTPLELIFSWNIESAEVKGCTMVAFDPSSRKAFHGNCFNVSEERIQGVLPEMGIQMHVKYATFLLDGMIDELEVMSGTRCEEGR